MAWVKRLKKVRDSSIISIRIKEFYSQFKDNVSAQWYNVSFWTVKLCQVRYADTTVPNQTSGEERKGRRKKEKE